MWLDILWLLLPPPPILNPFCLNNLLFVCVILPERLTLKDWIRIVEYNKRML